MGQIHGASLFVGRYLGIYADPGYPLHSFSTKITTFYGKNKTQTYTLISKYRTIDGYYIQFDGTIYMIGFTLESNHQNADFKSS